MSKKFWQIKNSANAASEILLYGPIASEHSWFGDEVTAKDFSSDLESLGNAPVTVRINSGGGDVFAAHAIHNLLLKYKGRVTVAIDGLCASAATIVAMADDKIIMPTNALFMIHNPMIALDNYYQAAELGKMVAALDKIKDSIVASYRKRCKASAEELQAMMDAETWLSAEECLAQGFIDEIEGNVEVVLDDKQLVINSAAYDISTFKNFAALKNHVRTPKEVTNKMTNLEAILNKLGLGKLLEEAPADAPTASKPANAAGTVPVDNAQAVAAAVAAERQRINALQAVDAKGNAAVAAIINTALAKGQTLDEVQPYIDAVQAAPLNSAQKLVENMLKDNKDSGVDNVNGNPQNQDDEQKAAEAKAMHNLVAAMNKFGGKQ